MKLQNYKTNRYSIKRESLNVAPFYCFYKKQIQFLKYGKRDKYVKRVNVKSIGLRYGSNKYKKENSRIIEEYLIKYK